MYSSKNNDLIKHIKKLNEKKYRDTFDEFLIEGMHSITEALKKRCVKYIISTDDIVYDNIKTIQVTEDILKYISNLDTPPNIMAVCKKINKSTLTNKIIILDGIQDPGNLGTIIRSSVAFGDYTLVLSEDTVDLYNPKVLRATQGMIFSLNIIRANLDTFLSSLKKKGYKIIGTNVIDGKSVKGFKNEQLFAIIMGNEGKGIRDNVKKYVDFNLYIPMKKECESLNVAVATSIILYELGD